MTQQKRLSEEELTLIKTGTTKLTAEALSGTVSRLLSHISALESELMVTDEKFRDWQNIANDRSKEICRLMAREEDHKREVEALREEIEKLKPKKFYCCFCEDDGCGKCDPGKIDYEEDDL